MFLSIFLKWFLKQNSKYRFYGILKSTTNMQMMRANIHSEGDAHLHTRLKCLVCAKASVMPDAEANIVIPSDIQTGVCCWHHNRHFYTLRRCLTLHSWCKRAHHESDKSSETIYEEIPIRLPLTFFSSSLRFQFLHNSWPSRALEDSSGLFESLGPFGAL